MTGFPRDIAIRDHLTLSGEYLGWLRTGRKSTTIRWRPGALDLPASDVLPLTVTGGAGGRVTAGAVRVLSVTFRRYGALTHAEAWRDGFTSAGQWRTALEGFYPDLRRDDWVTIYGIELLAGDGP